ncbi:Agamous-like MADS-box protein AGL62 [Morella rubra]|uniref:Agamous-like MADS-box protein AGL62 n=1 Tax=Morella rubra TaxID=262757 RepID=A0A6A1WM80_9ROSI|nr:Agamous-like MADS-box protein AGL62 [Morella rubra]KAB1226425.1 Agamous-like MADS-box protein AGL62 [Morella rubra]
MVMPKEVTKKTKGQQRIEMKRLVGSRQKVTLSKRRVGLFKKAAELRVLCSAKVAVLTLNNKRKMFSFATSMSRASSTATSVDTPWPSRSKSLYP